MAPTRALSVSDAPAIAAAMSRLAQIGLKPRFPEEQFSELARRIAEEIEGSRIPDPPLPLTWPHLVLSGSEQIFANANYYPDDCYDGATAADYAGVVASIVALAGEEWPGASVSARGVVRQGQHGASERIEITIADTAQTAPFDLLVDKNFDWSVVTRLNERLPAGATGRFAAFFDGNAIIVYLRPDQLKELGALFGYDFVSEIAPLEELWREQAEEPPPRPSYLAGAVRGRAPLWVLVICLLMGVFAAGRLMAMIANGAPYAIPGRDDTPIWLANSPVEFTLTVAVYALGAIGFIVAPLCQIALRLRELKRPRASAV
jgi:hypothetical protein